MEEVSKALADIYEYSIQLKEGISGSLRKLTNSTLELMELKYNPDLRIENTYIDWYARRITITRRVN